MQQIIEHQQREQAAGGKHDPPHRALQNLGKPQRSRGAHQRFGGQVAARGHRHLNYTRNACKENCAEWPAGLWKSRRGLS
jgi:hypothetical protein